MLVEIVTHCYSGPGGQYAKLLRYQLQSVANHRPQRIEARLTVIYPEGDRPTIDVLEEFRWPLANCLWLNPYPMERGRALMRPIGRNERSLATDADWVWHTDCDYVFGRGCLDALAGLGDAPLYYPAVTLICRDHATGDAYISGRPFDPTDFVPSRNRKAIGGIQIVPGEVARRVGYLKDWRRYQRPTDADTVVGFTGDAKFRKVLGSNGTPADIPECYRIRHSVTGDGRAEAAGIVPKAGDTP